VTPWTRSDVAFTASAGAATLIMWRYRPTSDLEIALVALIGFPGLLAISALTYHAVVWLLQRLEAGHDDER